jgi:hypothetical protein
MALRRFDICLHKDDSNVGILMFRSRYIDVLYVAKCGVKSSPILHQNTAGTKTTVSEGPVS